ncbi:MAG: class I SAM-dependent methyltransferase [Elusimicrobiota bacterium]
MPPLSRYARGRKLAFLLERIRPGHSVLEIGSGDRWLGEALAARGVAGYRSLDLKGPADYVGDIRDWKRLGIPAASFDFVAAFEVVEHVPCFAEIFALLKPGGHAFLTSPVPRWDGVCGLLESLGLSQKRTSPHDHLIEFEKVPFLEPVLLKRVGILSQWGLFRKPVAR